MKIGTKSVLFGAHQFLIHPWFVALAWWKLYGFPLDPRLWVAFFVHDIGYIGKPNMDGAEGERHVEAGARFLSLLFDRRKPDTTFHSREVWTFVPCDGAEFSDRRSWLGPWGMFSLLHSRFYAKRLGYQPSKLCAADKLAVALEPWWLYLPRVIVTGEINEYMAKAGGMPNSKYNGEGGSSGKYKSMNLVNNDPQTTLWQRRRYWHAKMCDYLRRWADTHKDGRDDTWTPDSSSRVPVDSSGVFQ